MGDAPSAVDWGALAAAAGAAAAAADPCTATMVPALVPRILTAGPVAPPASVAVGVACGGALARLAHAPPGDGAFWCRDGEWEALVGWVVRVPHRGSGVEGAPRDGSNARRPPLHYLHYPLLNPAGVADPHPQYKAAAEAALAAFLRERAREAAPGAMLLVATPGALGSRCAGGGALDALRDALAAAAAAGDVDAALLAAFAAPLYFYEARVSPLSRLKPGPRTMPCPPAWAEAARSGALPGAVLVLRNHQTLIPPPTLPPLSGAGSGGRYGRGVGGPAARRGDTALGVRLVQVGRPRRRGVRLGGGGRCP